jgi:hypothetical protein
MMTGNVIMPSLGVSASVPFDAYAPLIWVPALRVKQLHRFGKVNPEWFSPVTAY